MPSITRFLFLGFAAFIVAIILTSLTFNYGFETYIDQPYKPYIRLSIQISLYTWLIGIIAAFYVRIQFLKTNKADDQYFGFILYFIGLFSPGLMLYYPSSFNDYANRTDVWFIVIVIQTCFFYLLLRFLSRPLGKGGR